MSTEDNIFSSQEDDSNTSRSPLINHPIPFSKVQRKTEGGRSSVSMLTVSQARDYGSTSINTREVSSPESQASGRLSSTSSSVLQNVPERIVLDEHQLIELSDALLKIQTIIEASRTAPPVTRRRRMLGLPNWLVTDFLLFTLVLQVVVVGILTIIDGVLQGQFERTTIDLICNILMMVIEGIHFILMVAATVKLARQIILRKASFWFLVQCFLSSVLLYAGIYTLIYRFDRTSFIHFEPYAEINTVDKDSHLYTLLAFLQGLYLSVSTATLCGGSQIAAQKLYSTCVVSSQMLLSFMYFASILSEAISASNPRNLDNQGITIKFILLLKKCADKIREWVCCPCCCKRDEVEAM